jgi:hypothetical protein
MRADDRKTADQVERGIEGALGEATDADQTHSAEDQTKGAPAPPEERDANAPGGTDAQQDAATYGGE